MPACIDMDEVIASVGKQIENLLERTPSDYDCEYSWLLKDGECLYPGDEHDSVLRESMAKKVKAAFPGISTVDFAYWVMLYHFNAVRLNWDGLTVMKGKRVSRKQMHVLEFFVSLSRGFSIHRSSIFIEVVDDKMVNGGLPIVESKDLAVKDERSIDDLKKMLERHGIY